MYGWRRTPHGAGEAIDGKKQRNALTAAEQALRALGAGRAERADKSATKAADLDQIGAYAGLVAAAKEAAGDLEAGGPVSAQSWQRLRDAVGPGPLAFLIDELEGGGPQGAG